MSSRTESTTFNGHNYLSGIPSVWCAGVAVGVLVLAVAIWAIVAWRRCTRRNRPQPPSPIYITGSEVGRDPALRQIGRPVKKSGAAARLSGSSGGKNYINPVAAAFGRGSNGGAEGLPEQDAGLLRGQLSSTARGGKGTAGIQIVPLPGTPPRTAAEALAHMERQLAEQEQGSSAPQAEALALPTNMPEVHLSS
jgi:hypothetical protein